MWSLGREAILYGYDRRLLALAFPSITAGEIVTSITLINSSSLNPFVRNVICPNLDSLIGILPQPDDDIEEAPDVLLHYHGEKIN